MNKFTFLLYALFLVLLCVTGAIWIESISNEIPLESPSTTQFIGNVMTIDYKIIVGKKISSDEKISIQNIVKDTFNEVNTIYNKWNPQSELSRLNRLKAGVKVEISSRLKALLELTDSLVTITEGRFDPTIEPLQAIWKKHLEKGSSPSESELKAVARAIGWHLIHFKDGFFYKDHDNTQIDLGGIAKGYAVDLLVERLNGAGYPDVFVEWGGEIRASGKHPEERPWRIFISRLGDTNPDHAIDQIDLVNQSIATSGDYLQNWTIKDQAGRLRYYFHIINPITMKPLEMSHTSVASTSVAAPTCALADGIATALMLFPSVEEATHWANELKNNNPSLTFWITSRERSAGN